MSKYIKLPVEVEAIQWDGTNLDEIKKFVGVHYYLTKDCVYDPQNIDPNAHIKLHIKTLEGDMEANKNDYIIKGVKGEFYPCKPDIFIKTYKEIEDEENRKNFN